MTKSRIPAIGSASKIHQIRPNLVIGHRQRKYLTAYASSYFFFRLSKVESKRRDSSDLSSIAIDQFVKIETARPKLEAALANAKQPVDLAALLNSPTGRTWCTSTGRGPWILPTRKIRK